MTDTLALARPTLDALVERSSLGVEPAWLHSLRQQALDAFESLPWPDASQEEWRRVDLSGLCLENYSLDAPVEPDVPPGLHSLFGTGAHIAQGHASVVQVALPEELRRQGVLLTSLQDAVRRHPDLVAPHLGRLVSPQMGKVEALHTALWSGGAFLYVPRHVRVEIPVHATVWADGLDAAIFPHTLVVADEGSAVTLYEEHLSANPEAAALSMPVAEVVVGDGAHVRYVTIQRWGDATREVGTRRAAVGRDARLEWTTIVLGGRQSKMRLQAIFAEPGSQSLLRGFYFASGAQEMHLATLQEHRAPHTASDLHFRGALRGASRSVFYGVIRVHPGAQRTNGYQQNRNLLLSKAARADSIPVLEIEADDVRCTHGATLGHLDPDQLFYLMSRGLSRADAERLLVEGFLREILDGLPDASAREYVAAAVAAKVS